MTRPDPKKHNPDPTFLRRLVELTGLSQQEAAKAIGKSPRSMRQWLAGENKYSYCVQYALEGLLEELKSDRLDQSDLYELANNLTPNELRQLNEIFKKLSAG